MWQVWQHVLPGDTAHGHSQGVLDMVRRVRHRFPDIDLVAGNVATAEGTHALIAEGVDEQPFDPFPLVRAERVEPFVVRHGHDPSAEAFHGRELRRGRALGDDDRARDPEPPRVPRDALGHVPGTRGPDALRKIRLR